MTPARDPFAPLGHVGNRSLQFGTDGTIPAKYGHLMENAVRLAYQLALSPAFNEAFIAVLTKLGAKGVGKDTYLECLEKMVVNYAETAQDPSAVKQITEDDRAAASDRTFQRPLAFSKPKDRKIWLRERLLRSNSASDVAGALMHEAAHLAGAPTDPMAEWGLEHLGVVSGYRRR